MKFHLYLWSLAITLLFVSCSDTEELYEVLPVTQAPSLESAKIITDWNDLYLQIEKDLKGFRPAPTCRALAYINMGGFETVVPGMEHYKSLGSVLEDFNPPVLKYETNKINWPIALNAYYSRVHRFFLFGSDASQVNQINQLEAKELIKLSNGIAGGIVENSILWGQSVANAIITYSETDREGATQIHEPLPASYFPPSGTGLWEPTAPDYTHALFPYWGKVRTFAAKNYDLIAQPPVYKYSTDPTSKYYQDNLEVSNRVKNLTQEDEWIAEFWSDDLTGMTFSPAARFFAITNQIIPKINMNLEETLNLYCRLGIALNDAAVACWKSKYIYNTERPETYIQANIDPDFKPILGAAIHQPGLTPPFPGYPSGHSTFAGVGQRIFEHFFGINYEFTDLCHFGRNEFNGYPRTFTTWKQLAEEDAYSRIPLGVHIRMDCSEGLRLGNVMAVKALALDLQK
ncbi:MAG TPA: vanadium-dependent haloperoxidase [Saprospiraceae bacterium]|nr:vanadium-dependent haloperoxidase [Saprospiraceae bacterium]